MTIIYRLATINDIPMLSVLAQHVYAQTFGHSLSAQELNSILENNKSERAFLNSIEKYKEDYIVAIQGKEVIGYVGLRDPDTDFTGRQPTQNDQALNGIYVHPNHHRKGIGRALMDTAFSQKRFKDAEYVYLYVWDENKPAYHFYLNYGFEIVGTKECIDSGEIVGYDQVMMKRI